MIMYINSIRYNNSVVDGPGIRTVLFMQGCDIRCKGCQNQSSWDMKKGKEIEVNDLASELNKKVFNKKITISGGEPLMQKDALIELLIKLKKCDFDITLYTGHVKEEVPKEIIKKVNYLKTGNFIEKLKTTVKPFVGSTNQILDDVNNETIK